jgi:hypothetical protein
MKIEDLPKRLALSDAGKIAKRLGSVSGGKTKSSDGRGRENQRSNSKV